MSKKHFEAIAAALANAKPHIESSNSADLEFEYNNAWLHQWQRDVLAIADVCCSFNNNFNRSRFLSACGYEE